MAGIGAQTEAVLTINVWIPVGENRYCKRGLAATRVGYSRTNRPIHCPVVYVVVRAPASRRKAKMFESAGTA